MKSRFAWFLFFGMTCGVAASDWPQFRGAHGNGLAESSAPLSWGTSRNIKWKADLPGLGNSSPIVANGRVFVACAQAKGTQRGLYCFDRVTGRQLWERRGQALS